MSEWAEQSGQRHSLPIVLFANKADTITDSQQALRTGGTIEKLCRDEGLLGWFITSARTGESVEQGFRALLSEILRLDHGNEASIASRDMPAYVSV